MAKNSMKPASKIVLIGGSAGSLEVILKIIGQLGQTNDFAVIIVVHRRSSQDSPLTDLLAAKTSWEVDEPEEKDTILPNHLYIAPADYHLLIERDHSFSLDDSEKVNFSRPSIDVTFESAAEVYGANTTAVLLSGANADGVEGMQLLKQAGGTCIAQLPESAEVAYMPEQAIRHVQIDHILDNDEMAGWIARLVSA